MGTTEATIKGDRTLARLKKLSYLLQTLLQLGAVSVFRIFIYRSLLKIGYYRQTMKIKEFATDGIFFKISNPPIKPDNLHGSEKIISSADKLLCGELILFSHFDYQFQGCPDWFHDPFLGKTYSSNTHWTRIDEFGFQDSDVKILWETSRFSWAPTLAQAFIISGDLKYIKVLNRWMQDWCDKNPANQGIQWKCGQETSLRLLHFLTAVKLLGDENCDPVKCAQFVERHLNRISPTTQYAQAQRNNHLISEGAALFIGGYWLTVQPGLSTAQKTMGTKYHKKGRRLLEWVGENLIYSDGSFSQHSVVYHRMILDAYCLSEIWRRDFNLPPFSNGLNRKINAATDWLFTFTDPQSGDAPNLGGNDGAHIYNLALAEYRNFKPSIQLASILFDGHACYAAGDWDDQQAWAYANLKETIYSPKKRISKLFADGGYYIHICNKPDDSWFLFRLPYYRDRPPHSDALHFDLWSEGKNILIDSGTYSYTTGDKSIIEAMKGVAGHNTIQFANRDQMPALGRFLFGKWIRGKWSLNAETNADEVTAEYTDYLNVSHKRTIKVEDEKITVTDHISGPQNHWLLRWNLGDAKRNITHKDNKLWLIGNYNLEISSDDEFTTDCDLNYKYSQKYLKMIEGLSIQAQGEFKNKVTIITKIYK
ncbi:MAG: heparinase II/III-family protein [Kordiimonadaceae bacterium]|nr:heparinase II/III-family protein [Kordiimonadaceae bacterium]